MKELFVTLLGNLMTLLFSAFIRYYPVKNRLRVPVKWIIWIYAVFFILQSSLMILIQRAFPIDYRFSQLFKGLTMLLLPSILPFFLVRKSLFHNLFLFWISMDLGFILNGIANHVELRWGAGLNAQYPYLIGNLANAAAYMAVLPWLLPTLRKLMTLWPDENTYIWRIIWLIPALLALICAFSSSIFFGEDQITAISALIARVFIGVGIVVTCRLLVRALDQTVQNVKLSENQRITHRQLALQREQYERLNEDIERTRAARHDLHHQLTVLKTFSEAGDFKALDRYLDDITGAMPPPAERIWCENYAVNAVAGHYLSLMEKDGVRLDVKLTVPKSAGRVTDIDLCVLLGNLLENAMEALKRIDAERRFVRARSHVQGDYLSFRVENAFSGLLSDPYKEYLSSKEQEAGDPPVKGIGLKSVRAICEKYDGLLKIEITDDQWNASALVTMGRR